VNIKPILFNTEMVRAILEGRKTQTRRILKTRHGGKLEIHDDPGGVTRLCEKSGSVCHGLIPPYEAGDILWVRETFLNCFGNRFLYKADDYDGAIDRAFIQQGWNWKPSIHMPKEAVRIFLKVKDVRIEKLWAMDEEAAIAEGFEDSPAGTDSPLQRFSELWDKTIKRDDLREFGYHADPWVWVVEFERCEKPEGWCVDE
jgi:hypothetical protein